MTTTFIYALCEPGTRTVRYIGKADKPPVRIRQHCLERSSQRKTHLGCWLRSLRSRGAKPDMIVLREVPYDQWEIAEERYIRLAKGCGMDLVNETDGGNGVTMTPEMREKISAGGRNRAPISEITRARLREAAKHKPPISETTRENLRQSKTGANNPMHGKSGLAHHLFGNKSPKATSKFAGVFWQACSQKWAATFRKGGKKTHLGLFEDEAQAALAFDTAAAKHYGESARINFPVS